LFFDKRPKFCKIHLVFLQTHRKILQDVVLTAVDMKRAIFWDITCSPLKVSRCFGGTCHLHLQDRKISQARNQREADGSVCHLKMEAACSSEISVDFQRTTDYICAFEVFTAVAMKSSVFSDIKMCSR
jgi:hypothetical protein